MKKQLEKQLEKIFSLSNLRKMGAREPVHFIKSSELELTGVRGDTATYAVTLEFIPRDMKSYIDFQGDNSHLDEYDMMDEWYAYVDRFVGSRQFLDGLQGQMIKYVNKMFNRRSTFWNEGGSFGIYPMLAKEFEITSTEYGGSFTVLEKGFKGHFKLASGKFASEDSGLRNKLIRLAHTNPEIRKDILPLLKQSNWATKSSKFSLDGATEVWWLKLAEAFHFGGIDVLISNVDSQGVYFSSFGMNGVPALIYADNGFIYIDMEGVPAMGTRPMKKVPLGTTSKSDHNSIVKTFKKIRF